MAAKSHAPPVAREPAVGFGGTSIGHGTRTVSKGVEITLYSRWVDEKMSIGSAYAKELIRIADKAATATALVDLSPIATN